MTEKYIMKRTEILCPECFKAKLINEKGLDLYCDRCGQTFEFIQEGSEIIRYT